MLEQAIKHLRRSTSSTHFVPEIDGLRFYAIITVVIYHLNTAYSRQIGLEDFGFSLLGGKDMLGSAAWWIVRLDLGVKVFFAISGMVLALPFLRHYLSKTPKINLTDYFYRRLTRLEPPFIASLFFFLAIHVLLLKKSLFDMLPHLGTGLLYAHSLVYGEPNPINPVTWSLETEAQFYIVVPFFFSLLFFRREKAWVITILLLAFILSVWLKEYFIVQGVNQLASSVVSYFSNFMMGIIAAWLYIQYPNFFAKNKYIWDIIGFSAILGQFYFYKPQHIYENNILFNLFILLMILATFKGILMNWFFTRPLIYIIGGMCYSIYLLHYAFLHLLVSYTNTLTLGNGYANDLIIQIFICIPIVIAVSSAFYLVIEKPCMDKHWPKRLLYAIRNTKS